MSFSTIFIAVITALVAIVGGFLNGASALLLLRLKMFRNPFGYLMVLHSLSNLGLLVLFLIWATPITLFGLPKGWEKLNDFVGQLSLFFQTSSFHAMLFISMNRLTSIARPLSYSRYFSIQNTLYIVIFVIILSLLYFCIYFHPQCSFYFDESSMMWSFSATACGNTLAFCIDFCYNVALFALIMIFDIATLTLLRKANQRQGALGNYNTSVSHRREIKFFFQTFANSITYCLMLVSFHVIARIVPAGICVVLATTTAWELAHAGGGVILVAFNREIRKRLLRPWKENTTGITVMQTIARFSRDLPPVSSK
ncbi:hypothetical protein Y032_0024g1095 [Ancylostoma ceylanicum]|nr:hypothetical protein Y032_0024g1095 [Ancylostoma ceylanicum]